MFLGYEFSTYGTDVVGYSETPAGARADPMDLVFPKLTKCDFYLYGPSGSVQNKDGLCVLPLNIINEKIYVFLWFWFILVAAVTGVHLVYR